MSRFVCIAKRLAGKVGKHGMSNTATQRRHSQDLYISSLDWSQIAEHLIDWVDHLWPDMVPWTQSFLRSKIVTGNYRLITIQDAIRRVLSLDPQQSNWLILEVLNNCCQAHRAATNGDPYRTKRQRSLAYLKVRPELRKSVKTIRRALTHFPEESAWDLWQANLALKKHRVESGKADRPLHTDTTIVEIMAALEDVLDHGSSHRSKQPPVMGLNTGPMTHRYYAGPLIYPEALDHQRKQPQEALNGLIFSLSFHFRRATSGKQGEPWQAGSEMPNEGAPQIPLIVAFVKATFPSVEISPSIVRDRLKELTRKRVGLTLWPK